jgi:hypothetical protein
LSNYGNTSVSFENIVSNENSELVKGFLNKKSGKKQKSFIKNLQENIYKSLTKYFFQNIEEQIQKLNKNDQEESLELLNIIKNAGPCVKNNNGFSQFLYLPMYWLCSYTNTPIIQSKFIIDHNFDCDCHKSCKTQNPNYFKHNGCHKGKIKEIKTFVCQNNNQFDLNDLEKIDKNEINELKKIFINNSFFIKTGILCFDRKRNNQFENNFKKINELDATNLTFSKTDNSEAAYENDSNILLDILSKGKHQKTKLKVDQLIKESEEYSAGDIQVFKDGSILITTDYKNKKLDHPDHFYVVTGNDNQILQIIEKIKLLENKK